MRENSKITEYLVKIGLTAIEADIYLVLLKSGPLSVRDLAVFANIKRTTAYLYIDQLVEKGLVMKIVNGSKKQVAANSPQDNLKYLIDAKFQSAQNAMNEFPDLLKQINKSISKTEGIDDAEIIYTKGINSIVKIYTEALSGEELCLYATLSELAHLFPDDFFEKALERNKDLKVFEIYGDSFEKIQKFDYIARSPRYFHKFMPDDIGLTAPGILHYNNKVAIINTKGVPSAVILKNKDYYTNSKKLFDFIWKVLPDPVK